MFSIKLISLSNKYFCNKYPIYILCFQFSVPYTVKKIVKQNAKWTQSKIFLSYKRKRKIDNWSIILWFRKIPKSSRYYLHLFSQHILISQIMFHITWSRILLYCLNQTFSITTSSAWLSIVKKNCSFKLRRNCN